MRLGRCGAIVEPGSGTCGNAFSSVLAIGHAGSYENSKTQHFHSIAERDALIETFGGQARDGHRNHKFDAKTLRLSHCSARQFASAYAIRKSQVVFDSRTLSSLSARAMSFQQEGLHSFGSAIDSGR